MGFPPGGVWLLVNVPSALMTHSIPDAAIGP